MDRRLREDIMQGSKFAAGKAALKGLWVATAVWTDGRLCPIRADGGNLRTDYKR